MFYSNQSFDLQIIAFYQKGHILQIVNTMKPKLDNLPNGIAQVRWFFFLLERLICEKALLQTFINAINMLKEDVREVAGDGVMLLLDNVQAKRHTPKGERRMTHMWIYLYKRCEWEDCLGSWWPKWNWYRFTNTYNFVRVCRWCWALLGLSDVCYLLAFLVLCFY